MTTPSGINSATPRGARIAKPPIGRIYAVQLLLLLAVSVGLAWIDWVTAYSALLGGLISIGPNFYFALVAFRYRGARAAQEIARALYRGEVFKFVMSAALFACVFVLVKPLNAGVLFIALIVTMVLNTVLVLRLGTIAR